MALASFHGACPLDCWDTCSWVVEVGEGRIDAVRGDPDDPYTRGFLCPKAKMQLDRAMSDDRPLHPLVREGDTWKRISWDEALDLLACKIEDAIRKYGGESLFYYHDSGSTGTSKYLGLRLFRLLGATEPLGSLCWAAGIRAQEYDFGYHFANVPEDILNSKMVIIWGRNPAATNIHLVPLLKEAREGGTRVVLIDPVRSPTAGLVDEHIQIRPTTDAALALAMCHVIVGEGLADIPFIAAYTLGFGEFRKHLESFTPHWAERITGVPESRIRELARRYALAKPAAILMGYGLQRHYGGGNAVRACDALAAVTGNIGKSGGGANYANGYIARALRSLSNVSSGRSVRRIPRARMSELSNLEPPIQVMVVSCANPADQVPGASSAQAAFERIPFKAVLDLRWTDTCSLSDLFLPVASPFEDGDLHFCSWHPMVTVSERCTEPRGEALPDRLVWQKLALRLGLGKDFDRSLEEWIDLALEPVRSHGLTAKTLTGRRVRFPGIPDVAWGDCLFLTPSGKFEFYSSKAAREAGLPMASYVASEAGESGESPEFPLRLISPRRLEHLHSQFYHNILSPRGRPLAYASPEDLISAGLRDGDGAFLESAQGKISVDVRESPDMQQGIVLVFEGGSVLEGKGVNLLTREGETDMGHGPVYYDCFVRLRPEEN